MTYLDINDCINNTCQNGSTCFDEINSYSCNCTIGFNGTFCETGYIYIYILYEVFLKSIIIILLYLHI